MTDPIKEIEVYAEDYQQIVELSDKYDTSEAHIILALLNILYDTNVELFEYL